MHNTTEIEKAAVNYLDSTPSSYAEHEKINAFKAGAEWQKLNSEKQSNFETFAIESVAENERVHQQIWDADKPEELQEEVEKSADKLLCKMFEENGPKLLQFFLSCIARQMKDANAANMKLSCELSIKEDRYKISTNSNLKKISATAKQGLNQK